MVIQFLFSGTMRFQLFPPFSYFFFIFTSMAFFSEEMARSELAHFIWVRVKKKMLGRTAPWPRGNGEIDRREETLWMD